MCAYISKFRWLKTKPGSTNGKTFRSFLVVFQPFTLVHHCYCKYSRRRMMVLCFLHSFLSHFPPGTTVLHLVVKKCEGLQIKFTLQVFTRLILTRLCTRVGDRYKIRQFLVYAHTLSNPHLTSFHLNSLSSGWNKNKLENEQWCVYI